MCLCVFNIHICCIDIFFLQDGVAMTVHANNYVTSFTTVCSNAIVKQDSRYMMMVTVVQVGISIITFTFLLSSYTF